MFGSKKMGFISTLGLVVALSGQTSMAATTPQNTDSLKTKKTSKTVKTRKSRTSQQEKKEESVWSRFSMGYDINFAGSSGGPSLGDLSAVQVDQSKGERAANHEAINSYTTIGINYQISEYAKLYVNPRFNFYPVKGGLLKMLNTRIGVKSAKPIVSDGNFQIAYINGSLEIPSTPGAIDDGMIVAPGSFMVTSLAVGSSKLTLGTYSDWRFKFFTSTQDSKGDARKLFSLNVTPYLNYAFSPVVGVEFRSDNTTHLMYDGGWQPINAYLQFLVPISIVKAFNIAPYIWAHPSSGVTAKNTLIGAEISGAIF